MSTIITVIAVIAVIAVAIVAPWATIDAFEHSRQAGWLTAFVAIMAHVATWYIMSFSKEVAFFLAAPWAAYEFILSFIPMGIVEEQEAAATAADKG
jgi:hypothetical protein